MNGRNGLSAWRWSVLALGLSLTCAAPAAGQKKKENGPLPSGTPVLWRAPEDIAARDLTAGPGGTEMRPDLSNITFIKPEPGGYSVKYRVRDGAGHTWVVKVGKEARPETAAVRLVWAVGYVTEINYLVPCVHIPGAPRPRKDVPRCEGDGFADARFEARPDDVKRLDNWSWRDNPFTGTKELKGLAVLMALMNNWDLKDENNKVLYVKGGDDAGELQYIISDLGATFGKTGGALSHSRDEPEKYVKTKFVERVEGGRVRFAYHGKQRELFDDVTVADAKWIGGLLAQLTDEQLQSAFRAADFRPAEIDALSAAVRERINELAGLPGGEVRPRVVPGAR